MIMPAAQPPAFVYTHPGADPYRGTFDHAVAALAATLRIDPAALVAAQTDGYCRMRAWRQGETTAAMVYGSGRVVRNVHVDLAAWPAGASRLLVECTDGRGLALLDPTICGNWTVEFVPPFAAFATPPAGEGWTPGGWGVPANDTGGYGYGFGGAGYGGFGTLGVVPAAYEAPSGGAAAPPSAEIIPPFEETPPNTITPPEFVPPAAPPPGNGSSVSEPSSVALMVFGMVMLVMSRRRGGRRKRLISFATTGE